MVILNEVETDSRIWELKTLTPINGLNLKQELKVKIMYILKEFPNGMRQKELMDSYKELYGIDINPEYYGLQNIRQVCLQFPDLVLLKMNNSIQITDKFKSTKDQLLFKPLKDMNSFLHYLPRDLKVGDCTPIAVESIYDPSKFWIIPKYDELTKLMDYFKWYYNSIKRHKIKIPTNMISLNLLCILYKNSWYFRVIIINRYDKENVQVFSVDYGRFVKCNICDLYYIRKNFANIPRFCFRARLANICPTNYKEFWSEDANVEFKKLIHKRALMAKVLYIEEKQNVIHVAIRELCGHVCPYINDLLVSRGVAQYLFSRLPKNDEKIIYKTYIPLVKQLCIFPSFEMLESGTAPHSLKFLLNVREYHVLDLHCKFYLQYYDVDEEQKTC